MSETIINIPFLEDNNKANWLQIFIFMLSDIILLLFIIFILYEWQFIYDFSNATWNLIQPTLIGSLLLLGIFLIFYFYWVKNPISSLGLNKSNVIEGIVVTLIMWTLIQVISIIISYIQVGKVTIDSSWSIVGASALFGELIAQLFGNALFEETAFRGFLLPQIYKNLKMEGKYQKMRIFIAVLLSQTFFGFMHLPIRFAAGYTLIEALSNVPLLIGIGVVFCIVYLHTQNLFIAVGIHALWNTPMVIISYDATFAIIISTIILLIVWKPLKTRL